MSQNLKTNEGFGHDDASLAVSQNLKANESFDHDDAFPAISVHVGTKGFQTKIAAIYAPNFTDKPPRNEICTQLKIIWNL